LGKRVLGGSRDKKNRGGRRSDTVGGINYVGEPWVGICGGVGEGGLLKRKRLAARRGKVVFWKNGGGRDVQERGDRARIYNERKMIR